MFRKYYATARPKNLEDRLMGYVSSVAITEHNRSSGSRLHKSFQLVWRPSRIAVRRCERVPGTKTSHAIDCGLVADSNRLKHMVVRCVLALSVGRIEIDHVVGCNRYRPIVTGDDVNRRQLARQDTGHKAQWPTSS